MTTDINNFIYIIRQKNGKIRIKHDITNEGNIYELLHDFGFRKSKLDNKKIYYHRGVNGLKVVEIHHIERAFLNFLENAEYTNIPDDLTHHDILNWYYSRLPIKENGLFDHYLRDTLAENEIHSLRLQTNCDYKHEYEIKQFLLMFEDWNFSKSIDTSNSFTSSENPLYYKHINERDYLVFNHWNSNSKYNDGFDCWIATYANEEQIGLKEPFELNEVSLGFEFAKDLPIIKQYLN